MPKSKILRDEPTQQPMDAAEIRAKALEMYCTMRIVKLRAISECIGVPTTTIENWRDRGDWAAIRDKRQRDSVDELLAKAGDPKTSAIETLEICRTIKTRSKKFLAEFNHNDPNIMAMIVNTATKVHELEKDIYKGLGL